jgi:hypothetical protein
MKFIAIPFIFLSACSHIDNPTDKAIETDYIVAQEILQKSDDRTMVIFTLNSLFTGNNRVPNLSKTVAVLQEKGIKVLVVANIYPLWKGRAHDYLRLLKSQGYDFCKSWANLSPHSFNQSDGLGPMFMDGCLFFDLNCEVDYWGGIELFMIYANLADVKKILLVHEQGINYEEFNYRNEPLRCRFTNQVQH